MPVPDFAPNEVLTASAMDQIGLWLVKTETVGTSVANIPVTNVFSSDFDNYLIQVQGVTISGGGRVKLTINGSTGSTYRFGGWRSNMGGAVLDSEQGANQTSWTLAVINASGVFGGQVTLFGPNKTTNTIMNAQFAETSWSSYFNGFDTGTAASTGFTIDDDSARTFTGGTIRVYGYRN